MDTTGQSKNYENNLFSINTLNKMISSPEVFKLNAEFLNQYINKKINWGPLGEFVFMRTYSRIKEDGFNESWQDCLIRVVEGCYNIQKRHCLGLKLPWSDLKAQTSAQKMFDLIFNFKFLPPGRNLWMAGTPYVQERGGACLNNCAFVSTKDLATKKAYPFCWTLDALMVGAGVGFDVKGADQLRIVQPCSTSTFVIADSKEGWVESLHLLLSAFFEFYRPLPIFDYSLIRKAGSPIKGFGGISAGPEPLKVLHQKIEQMLTAKIGQLLSSTDIVDIENMIGVTVVAGNIRRSAELALGNIDDLEYVTMKDYNKHPEEVKSFRWASNNSVFAEVGKTDYQKIQGSIALNGEPGLVWLDNLRKYGRLKDGINDKDSMAEGTNPCGEQTLEDMEMCNLMETFPSLHNSYQEYQETLKYAYLCAKTVTLVPTHWPETNAVMMKNRRIGLSQSGIVDAFNKHGRRTMLNWCDQAYVYLRKLDKIYSDWLCIPQSIKITSVKPSGSVSLLPGVSAGIHYPHSEYYIRRVRIATNSQLCQIMKTAGYDIEYSQYGLTEKEKLDTSVISFPVHEQFFNKKKTDVTIWQQVQNAVDLQHWWADNNVSITVTVQEHEKRDIIEVLQVFEDRLKAISFLPYHSHGYVQAPYEEITKEKYLDMIKNLQKPDFTVLTQMPIGTKFCDGEVCLMNE